MTATMATYGGWSACSQRVSWFFFHDWSLVDMTASLKRMEFVVRIDEAVFKLTRYTAAISTWHAHNSNLIYYSYRSRYQTNFRNHSMRDYTYNDRWTYNSTLFKSFKIFSQKLQEVFCNARKMLISVVQERMNHPKAFGKDIYWDEEIYL